MTAQLEFVSFFITNGQRVDEILVPHMEGKILRRRNQTLVWVFSKGDPKSPILADMRMGKVMIRGEIVIGEDNTLPEDLKREVLSAAPLAGKREASVSEISEFQDRREARKNGALAALLGQGMTLAPMSQDLTLDREGALSLLGITEEEIKEVEASRWVVSQEAALAALGIFEEDVRFIRERKAREAALLSLGISSDDLDLLREVKAKMALTTKGEETAPPALQKEIPVPRRGRAAK